MQTTTTRPITSEQIDQFHRDGFLVVENLLPKALVEELVQRFDPLWTLRLEYIQMNGTGIRIWENREQQVK